MYKELERLKQAEEAFNRAQEELTAAKLAAPERIKVYRVELRDFLPSVVEFEATPLGPLQEGSKDLKVRVCKQYCIAYESPSKNGTVFLSAESALKGYSLWLAGRMKIARDSLKDYERRRDSITAQLADLTCPPQ